MRNLDFSSWQNLLSTLFALALVTLIGVGIRLVAMSTIQQRRERANRQINERLRVLIAAYKTLGGSFTGDLTVDPTHLRDLRRRAQPPATDAGVTGAEVEDTGSDRARRMRDAVEGALSDIILLGTEDHVRLAERVARELVAGRQVHTHELVVSLRDFIRKALDIDPVPADLEFPRQGPARPGASGERGKGKGGTDGERGSGGAGNRGGGGMALGASMGGLAGLGTGEGTGAEDKHSDDITARRED
jgi:type II secretory pathway pseudopilin PulG